MQVPVPVRVRLVMWPLGLAQWPQRHLLLRRQQRQAAALSATVAVPEYVSILKFAGQTAEPGNAKGSTEGRRARAGRWHARAAPARAQHAEAAPARRARTVSAAAAIQWTQQQAGQASNRRAHPMLASCNKSTARYAMHKGRGRPLLAGRRRVESGRRRHGAAVAAQADIVVAVGRLPTGQALRPQSIAMRRRSRELSSSGTAGTAACAGLPLRRCRRHCSVAAK
jgi:hypothetical protein